MVDTLQMSYISSYTSRRVYLLRVVDMKGNDTDDFVHFQLGTVKTSMCGKSLFYTRHGMSLITCPKCISNFLKQHPKFMRYKEERDAWGNHQLGEGNAKTQENTHDSNTDNPECGN